jgi:hypothetical protein
VELQRGHPEGEAVTALFDRLNLRPGERRLLVLVALAGFVVMNMIFVWPRFGELGRELEAARNARAKAEQFRAEAAKAGALEARLRELEDAGSQVASAEQALALQTTVQMQAAQSGVTIMSYDSRGSAGDSRTAEFFQEQTLRVTALSTDAQLVGFLHKLGTGNSLISVRDLDVRPDQAQMKLNCTITLVASYQKAAARKNFTASTP